MTKTKILVIEKEGIVAMDLKNMLQSFGYSVPQVALSGKTVLTVASKIKPDLVLLDEKVKAESKVEICLAEKKFHSQRIPIIYLTTRADHTLLMKNGPTHHFIKKPFNSKELHQEVSAALK